jgi:putative dimethyl sulfoxide reductase chaperone
MSVKTGVSTGDVQFWLERSSVYLFASLALQVPDQDSAAAMASLMPSLAEHLQPLGRAIVDLPQDQREPEYFSVLGPGGCAASESSYERGAIASRGPLLADVAGYYEAFGFRPEVREVPDHVAVELGFASYLALKIAFARHSGRDEEASVAEAAWSSFTSEHLWTCVAPLCEALIASGSEHYAAVAEFVSRACAGPALE